MKNKVNKWGTLIGALLLEVVIALVLLAAIYYVITLKPSHLTFNFRAGLALVATGQVVYSTGKALIWLRREAVK